MQTVNMQSLLDSEEEKLRGELRADALIDRNRKQSVVRLNDVFSQMLLRYNAANSDDRTRQAIADGLTATAQDMLGLLQAAEAKKEIEKRRVRTGAIIGLLLTVICMLAAVLSIRDYFPVGCVFMVGAAVCGFTAGRLWYGEREVRVRIELDPDLVWKTIKKTVETMDRKTEEFLAQEQAWEQDASSAARAASLNQLGEEEIRLYGDLLEALYSGNGEFALRQLKKLLPYLRSREIETRDYDPESAEYFELLPTKKEPGTQRPAILQGERLLLAGRATERAEQVRRS